ncbi:hypothetical protein [Streptomyces sp. NBRC 110611]|nr:hypothetical protein [Streptomyces sp. NBRC 110611]
MGNQFAVCDQTGHRPGQPRSHDLQNGTKSVAADRVTPAPSGP